MTKLNVVIMGQNCEKFIGMCLESVKEADNIIYCDGGSTDKTFEKIGEFYVKHLPNKTHEIIKNPFDQEDKGMNGKQRNFYLNYLKEHYMGEWALALDADEVVGNLNKIKELLTTIPQEQENRLVSIKMRHFIGDLGKEDADQKEHFVPNRLFKVREELVYPELEHSVLWIMKDGKALNEEELGKYVARYSGTTIWHLAYCSGIWDIKKRYLNHLKKSEMHTKEFMDGWYFSHLFGIYPTTPIRAMDIPPIILKEFLIDPDKIYFMNRRTLEVKHFVMSSQWIKHFNPKIVLDLGCGLGMYGYALTMWGVEYQGLDISKWAIENTIYKSLKIKQGDITEPQDFKDFDLVLCIDILEHLEEKDLDKTLELIKNYGKNFLFSIPFIGDSNLESDPTHKIKKERQWWINKISNKFRVKEVPDYFVFKHQMLIGEPR